MGPAQADVGRGSDGQNPRLTQSALGQDLLLVHIAHPAAVTAGVLGDLAQRLLDGALHDVDTDLLVTLETVNIVKSLPQLLMSGAE